MELKWLDPKKGEAVVTCSNRTFMELKFSHLLTFLTL